MFPPHFLFCRLISLITPSVPRERAGTNRIDLCFNGGFSNIHFYGFFGFACFCVFLVLLFVIALAPVAGVGHITLVVLLRVETAGLADV